MRPARLAVLTRVTSSVLPGNNIYDTFLIGSATDKTKQWIGVLIHLLYINLLITKIGTTCAWYTTQANHGYEFHLTDYGPLRIRQIGI